MTKKTSPYIEHETKTPKIIICEECGAHTKSPCSCRGKPI